MNDDVTEAREAVAAANDDVTEAREVVAINDDVTEAREAVAARVVVVADVSVVVVMPAGEGATTEWR